MTSSCRARLTLMGLTMLMLTASRFAVEPATAEGGFPGALPDRRIARGSTSVAEAWLADATARYRHFVLGDRYEAASLKVRLRDGRIVDLTLPETSVFEDRQPRLADLDGDGTDEVILVRSETGRGAALAVIGLDGGGLRIRAETPPTGRSNTWLNPAGIADFDGDGRLDIAYVQMPHVLGVLRVWTLRSGKLVEIASVPDTSNHVAGSPELALSAIADFDGDGVADLAVPSKDRRSVRLLRFRGGVSEIARLPLPAPVTGDFRLSNERGRIGLDIGLANGARHRLFWPR